MDTGTRPQETHDSAQEAVCCNVAPFGSVHALCCDKKKKKKRRRLFFFYIVQCEQQRDRWLRWMKLFKRLRWMKLFQASVYVYARVRAGAVCARVCVRVV
jgi:hypothetical protein